MRPTGDELGGAALRATAIHLLRHGRPTADPCSRGGCRRWRHQRVMWRQPSWWNPVYWASAATTSWPSPRSAKPPSSGSARQPSCRCAVASRSSRRWRSPTGQGFRQTFTPLLDQLRPHQQAGLLRNSLDRLVRIGDALGHALPWRTFEEFDAFMLNEAVSNLCSDSPLLCDGIHPASSFHPTAP